MADWEAKGDVYCQPHRSKLVMDQEGVVRHLMTGTLCDVVPNPHPMRPPRLGESNWRELDREILRLRAKAAVLEIREKELLDLKGPCSNKTCSLHYAHSGPCGAKGDR